MTLKTALPALIGLTTAIALLTPAAALAITGFTGVFAPSNFSFTPNPPGAGTPDNDLDITNAATGTIILYSPDDAFNNLGTGVGAMIDWTIPITADRAGTISFDWSYEPFDPGIGDDSAFYLLNDIPVVLATNDGTPNIQNSLSPISLTVANGDVFGFRVSTLTNSGGAGAFTVHNFTVTPDFTVSPVPTPTLLPGLIGMGIAAIRRRKQQAETED